jgi:hypothetical protein
LKIKVDGVLAKDSEDLHHQFKARRKKGASKGKEKREESHKREAKSRNPDSKVSE